ncbi:SRPBCC family protein [Gordonia sp. 'Campus']|uniref:SRPBCC family protein n=1 Tax=Gordonia sp. 'Campus' TaxID=2915824 RepID=UPI001EE3FA59|nr:SRPBCC family protein [Gordonia sp. 'Campus']
MTISDTDRDARFTHSESIHIDVTPQQVWDLVTDIGRTGEWSLICKACWWAEPATGPEVGAYFHGRNETPERVWETRSRVVAADEPREFSWMVNENAVRWSYTIAPDGDGTTLTESWAVQPAGFDLFAERFGDDASRQLEQRREAALSGIPATLAAIKEIAERGPSAP